MPPRVEMGAQGEETGRAVGYSHQLQPSGSLQMLPKPALGRISCLVEILLAAQVW